MNVTAWYMAFMPAVFVLWLAATDKDQPAARVVLLATIGAELTKILVSVHIVGAWKLVIPGAIETLTILALLKWARGRTGYMQAGALVIAWVAHVLCYVDIRFNTDVVYSRYETVLALVAAIQLAAFYDTIHRILFDMVLWLRGFRFGSVGAVRIARAGNGFLRDSRFPRV